MKQKSPSKMELMAIAALGIVIMNATCYMSALILPWAAGISWLICGIFSRIVLIMMLGLLALETYMAFANSYILFVYNVNIIRLQQQNELLRNQLLEIDTEGAE